MSMLKRDSHHVDFSTLLVSDNTVCPSNVDGMLEIESLDGINSFLFTEIKMPKESWHGLGAPRALLAQAKQPNTIVLRVNVSGELAPSGAVLFMPVSYQRAYRVEGDIMSWSRSVETSVEDFLRRFMEWKRYAKAGKLVLAAACFPVV